MYALPMVYCLLFTTVASVLLDGQEHVCELDNITISCAHSPNTTLHITCANYGRTSNYTCYDISATSTECIGHNSLLIATGLCQNHVSCTVVADNAVFGDPCSGVSKYLELGYECRESEPQAYECYSWTAEDEAQLKNNNTHHSELEKRTCEGHPGYVFAEGNNTLAPGCGNCSCCKPAVSADSVCPERSTTISILSQTTQSSTEVTTIPTSSSSSTDTVDTSTHSQTPGSVTIEDSEGFLDDPTNVAVISTAAGVAGLGAMFITGYVLVSHGNKITSLCSKSSTSIQPA